MHLQDVNDSADVQLKTSFTPNTYSLAHTVSALEAHAVSTGLEGQVLHTASQSDINPLSTILHTSKLIIILEIYFLTEERVAHNLERL